MLTAPLLALVIVLALILTVFLVVIGLTVGVEYVQLRLRRRWFLKRLARAEKRVQERAS